MLIPCFVAIPTAYIYPSLQQLDGGILVGEDMKQKSVCLERYKRKVEEEHGQRSEVDLERENECGICMESNTKIALPDCNHSMCLKCYREWYGHCCSCLQVFLHL